MSATQNPRKVVLTGMRPSGFLHTGHLVGALTNWKKVQDSGDYECYFLIADVQVLTTNSDRPEIITTSVRNMVLDWLSVGLDPALPNVHFVLQSMVPERYELSILLQMVANFNILMDNPTLKEELKRQKNVTVGFITYPVDQAADILMVCPVPASIGDELLVPVGKDQESHLEFANHVVSKFNETYGKLLLSCTALIGNIGRLVGTDGREKMGKSTQNAIFLTDTPEIVRRKVMRMYSDPNRQDSPAIQYHRAFNPGEETEELIQAYQELQIGDKELKERLLDPLERVLTPIRERRKRFEQTGVHDIVEQGTQAARTACRPVIEAVREKMHLAYPS